MGVYTFVCKNSGGEWTAKQHSGDLEGSAANTYDLQRSLVKAALASGDSGAVQSSFSYVTPTSAVFQVVIGGAVLASVGGAAAAAPSSGAAAAEAPKEEKKPEKEESEDEDMGFSLFD